MMTSGVVVRQDVEALPDLSGRPKVLFLACYFPPGRSSASVRTWNIAKHLARLDWDVTVVTPSPSLWRHVDDPQKVSRQLEREGIRRIITGHRWRSLSPDHMRCWNNSAGWVFGGLCRKIARRLGIDAGIGWIHEATRSCATLTHEVVDVVLATGDPFASFSLAKRLSEQCNCGYVLDYRDAWALPSDGVAASRILKQESELIESSIAVTAVSPSLLNGRHHVAGKLSVVSNGFDPDEMQDVTAHKFDHFAIIYAGIFHPPTRVVTPLMVALKRLHDTNQAVSWRFHYYGPDEDHVREEARRFRVTERLIVHGQVARREALSALKGAHMSIVITSVLDECDPEDRGIVTGKIFDSIGLRVPILVIGPTGSDVEDIVNTTGLGRMVPASNIDGMVEFFQAAIAGETRVPKHTERYAWPNIIKRLDSVLRNAVARHRSYAQKDTV